MKHIPKEKLIHGEYYFGRCRNAGLARWDAGTQEFVYLRRKFGTTFYEYIKCPEDDNTWDTFYAEELCPDPEIEIPIENTLY